MQKRSYSAKTLSVILSLLMLLGACPIFGVISSAAPTPTKISSISLEIDKPRPGLTPDYEAVYDIHCQKTTRFDETDKMINGISWRYQKVNTPTNLKKTDTFVKGVQYTFSIVVQVKDGYEFDAVDNYTTKVTAYVNGKRATVIAIHGEGYNAKNVLVINYTFDACDYFTIKTVSLYDIKVPKMGEEVSFDATPAGTGYTVSTVNWHDDTANRTLKAGDVFLANHKYTVEIYVRANDGTRLQTDSDDLPDFTAKINNIPAELIVAETNGGIAAGFRVTYSTDSVISKVSVSDIEIPKAGNHADYTCKIDGIGYELDTFGIDWTKNGGFGSELPVAETFVAGQSYELKVWLKAKDGYSFKTNSEDEVIAEAKINGETAEVYLNATDKDCQIIYVYTVPEDIKAVDVTGVAEPFAGGTAMMTAAASSPDYEVTDVEWIDTTDGYGSYIYNITSFSEGREYTANIILKTTGNNSFRLDPDYDIPDITAKINGKSAGVYSEGGRDKAIIYYRFRTPVEVVTVTGLNEPVAGETPDMTAESTKAGYKINKIEWFDNSVTPAVKLSETDTFTAGHNYTVQITLYATDDFMFNVVGGYQEITATINGNKAITYGSDQYGTAVIGYSFTIPVPHTHTPVLVKGVAATCTANGTIEHYKCSGCAKLFSDAAGTKEITDATAKATGHSVKKIAAVKATCTVNGTVEHYKCEKCAKLFYDAAATKEIADVTAKAPGHSYEWVVTKPAQVGVAGEQAYTCKVCKDVKEKKPIAALEAEYMLGDVDFSNKVDATDARLALRAAVGLEKLSEKAKKAADVDKNSAVNATDARLILRAAVGLEILK